MNTIPVIHKITGSSTATRIKRNHLSGIAVLALVLTGSFAIGAEAAGITSLKTRIETPHFSESVTFYTTLLGMQVLDTWDDDGDKGAILGLSDSTGGTAFLELAYSNIEHDHAGLSLQFRVADIEAVIEKLHGQWEYRGPVERPWGSTYLYLQDPAGVDVIVYAGKL